MPCFHIPTILTAVSPKAYYDSRLSSVVRDTSPTTEVAAGKEDPADREDTGLAEDRRTRGLRSQGRRSPAAVGDLKEPIVLQEAGRRILGAVPAAGAGCSRRRRHSTG